MENETKKVKIQKNVELVSMIASQIEEMNIGERIRVTPFAHSIQMSSGSHPHVDTVKGKLNEAYLWQDITKKIKFLKKGNQIVEIEKCEETKEHDVDILIKKELRGDLQILKNGIDLLNKEIKQISSTINLLNKKDIALNTKLDRIEESIKK